MPRLTDALKHLYGYLKSCLPVARRRQYTKLQHKYEALAQALISRSKAHEVDMLEQQPMQPEPGQGCCPLVSHADRPQLKPHLQRLWHNVLNLPDEAQVIDVYECQMQRLVMHAGLQCEVLFPALSRDPLNSNDMYTRWNELLDRGLPFVKTSVARTQRQHPYIAGRVPGSWLADQ